MIAALADMEQRVRRPLEVSGASARLDGLAGPASWVSGIKNAPYEQMNTDRLQR